MERLVTVLLRVNRIVKKRRTPPISPIDRKDILKENELTRRPYEYKSYRKVDRLYQIHLIDQKDILKENELARCPYEYKCYRKVDRLYQIRLIDQKDILKENELTQRPYEYKSYRKVLFTNPSARAGYDTW